MEVLMKDLMNLYTYDATGPQGPRYDARGPGCDNEGVAGDGGDGTHLDDCITNELVVDGDLDVVLGWDWCGWTPLWHDTNITHLVATIHQLSPHQPHYTQTHNTEIPRYKKLELRFR